MQNKKFVLKYKWILTTHCIYCTCLFWSLWVVAQPQHNVLHASGLDVRMSDCNSQKPRNKMKRKKIISNFILFAQFCHCFVTRNAYEKNGFKSLSEQKKEKKIAISSRFRAWNEPIHWTKSLLTFWAFTNHVDFHFCSGNRNWVWWLPSILFGLKFVVSATARLCVCVSVCVRISN